MKSFLFELGCAELPANKLQALIAQIGENISNALQVARLDFSEIKLFATPRRLGVLVKNLNASQANRFIEKRGPSLKASESAVLGFAKSCQVDVKQLVQKDGYYYYCFEEIGQSTDNLLPHIITRAFSNVRHIKMMRWGNHTSQFLRPVYWAVVLYGEEEVQMEILGVKTSRYTYGHRFHHPGKIILLNANDYEDVLLEEGLVRASFQKRKEYIRQQVIAAAKQHKGKALIDESLLDEVTGLVEWPVVLTCQFQSEFLSVPKEALILSMQHHQKCFPVMDESGNHLLNFFITVSNINSQDSKVVVTGNERVMRARLSDALFFYEQDKKTLLGLHLKSLEKVVFQEKLGSMADRVKRIALLSQKIAEALHTDKTKTRSAAILCKTDLMTYMVKEFPELQGIMGGYYVKAQGESEEIAKAIQEHYLPRFATDILPQSPIGCAIALADRFDIINSIFSIGETPTGEKDPFGLRRAALGIIRIIIEKELSNINLSDFCGSDQVIDFILDRLPGYFHDQGFTPDALHAALEVQQTHLHDLNLRMLALKSFRDLPEAYALCEANKRVKNILKKNSEYLSGEDQDVNPHLFGHEAEKNLYQKILRIDLTNLLGKRKNYNQLLVLLAGFKNDIDLFFAEVLVEVENKEIKYNRLKLLQSLRNLFLQVADISLLQLGN